MITTEDYFDLEERARSLGCTLDPILTFLPSNIDSAASPDDFLVPGEATTIRKILDAGGVGSIVLKAEGSDQPRFVHNQNYDWAMPIIFFSAETLRSAPDLPNVAIDLIRDYALNLFKGAGASKIVKAEIVVERDNDRIYQKVVYEGDVPGLAVLADMVVKVNQQQ
ncbi:MAG: hypothetical protein EOO77_02325 [Oxalobacteraceae bacterium]|nr:MAG: hypothetical protein EOO77_02325 [Oxalobacteraceae bacterium]